MSNLLTIQLDDAVIRLDVIDGAINLYVNDGSGDAAVELDEKAKADIAAVLAPSPPTPTVPDGLSPAAHAIASHIAQGMTALADLLKARPGEVDYVLRHFVKHVSNFRGHVLTEAA